MAKRLQTLGVILAVIGLAFLAGAGVAYAKVQDGYTSLKALSTEQNVTLSYNEDGELVDRGETAGAEAIMSLLEDDWKYPVVESDLDPNDPLVNTASEYMYQMATVTYHTLHSTVTVNLDAPAEYNGETFAAGPHEFEIDGRYWTDFDREHPLEGPAREMAWTGVAHGLTGELGVGTVTHNMLQLGLGVAALLGGIGGTSILLGLGLVWVARSKFDAAGTNVSTRKAEAVGV